MKNRQTSSTGPADLDNAPNAAFERARQHWAERMGQPIVERNRWFIVSIVLALALTVSLLTINSLVPLKTVVPYIVKVDQATGEVAGRAVAAANFKPGDAEKKYFIMRWVRNIIDLEANLTEQNLRTAFLFVRGKAVDEYKDFMIKTRPLARLMEEKTLSRKTEIVSFNFQGDNSANVRFETEERVTGVAPVIKRFAAYITFEIVPPKTDREILENPLGLFITHFTIAEEIK